MWSYFKVAFNAFLPLILLFIYASLKSLYKSLLILEH